MLFNMVLAKLWEVAAESVDLGIFISSEPLEIQTWLGEGPYVVCCATDQNGPLRHGLGFPKFRLRVWIRLFGEYCHSEPCDFMCHAWQI